ncbi:3-alpha-hydroxysteroid dehydrogenase [Aerococcus urinaehominis]|uniref:3-alpha-hydroxysteroid dehydrogenase n=1 Tax=Aerococcus urinaehominis TaxID=128944 RepID=A0A109RH84_9LACT|nr:glucose 1-dehydrogenase [Aerococcus urinaehominis]AMB99786.1 3-alpha-hydroxysteroid dehydrogenase [Aerococcus urinaehominis]SDM09042.1 3alpha(or 20beta)-hydroxysteroid dehydrogenase [Aerococcus urinaehominis]
MGKLAGKVAIITGGANGMGETHVRLFVAEGAKVAITDIDAEKGQALADELGDVAIFIKHDVSSEADWQAVVKETESAFGPINILINNAGVSTVLSAEHSSLDEYMQVIKINQVSVFLGMKYTIASMKEAGSGAIVNISSINGLNGGAIAYTDSKFAVRGMTKAAAKEFARYGVRVNSVHPGIIRTPMVENSEAYEQIQQMVGMVPLQRMAEPEEISKLVLFLASDDASYSTGSEFIADGGILA